MKRILIILMMLAFASAGHAAWTLLDDFESYDNSSDTLTTVATGGIWTSVFDGTGNSHVIDFESGQVLQTKGGAAWRGAERNLAGTGAAIVVNEVQTYFWQVQVSYSNYSETAWVYDFMMGLSPSVANIDNFDAWQDFSVMPYVNNAPSTPFINADGPGTFWAPMSPETWTNVWVIVDNDASAPTFDLYYSTGADAPTLVEANANWRNFAGNVDLNAIGFMAAGWEFTEYLIDNIYYAPGEDLTNPISGQAIIVTNPVDTTVNENQSAVFSTVFSSDSTPTATWYKIASPSDTAMNPANVQTSYNAQSGEYTSTLTINDTAMSDAGQYYCKIVNGSVLPQMSEAAVLTVYGLLAHWTLDQDSYVGGYYQEEIKGYHAAVIGTPTFVADANGTANQAAQISANDGWALCPTMNPVNEEGQVTVSFWVNWGEAQGAEQDLLAEYENDQLLQTNGLIADGQWQHVCMVIDGTNAKLYIDGLLANEGTWSSLPLISGTMNIGIDSHEQNPLNGALDDVRLYNYALSGTDIADIRYAHSGERSCILSFDATYDLSGPLGQPDCVINIYDLVAFAEQWLSPTANYHLAELADLASSWQTDGLYP